ncbi:amino acid transporter [Deinococcus pimensis]|uniref:amino acid transporter n=1 Tax=Deinococcus pimensis TaxID=309888 RepID=UPI000487A191|nr:amino acid transporter [Deinococcus pimensis]
MTAPTPNALDRLKRWLLEPQVGQQGALVTPPAEPDDLVDGGERAPQAAPRTYPWWRVMSLTGVDYFSTLGYQPGVAFLAAGALSPVATLVLVLVTLLGALPVYRQVARESPHGEGSISILERLLPWWPGKLMVLVLIGFLITDLTITVTLSAADASVHLVRNPLLSGLLQDRQPGLTLVLILLLGAIFLRGFRLRVSLAAPLVVAYVGLGAVLIVRALVELAGRPELLSAWREGLLRTHGDPLAMLAVAALLFPRLALGLSGFETGVTVMPLVRGDPDDASRGYRGRIRQTRQLLLVVALVMSVLLLGSSLVTTLLIPAEQFRAGGEANGRALAYLAHALLGPVFGTAYDLVTILILWFASASALGGLLNLVPRYLPRYGMAPDWARVTRPLVLLFTVICVAVTIIFGASVDAQAGAYATGVLVLITGASVAVTLSARRRYERVLTLLYALIAAVFVYTTIANAIERPAGVRIGAVFILAVVVVSILSRATRSTELRYERMELDRAAERFLIESGGRPMRFVAHHPGPDGRRSARSTTTPDERGDEYRIKTREARAMVHLPPGETPVFIEVHVTDASEFSDVIEVRGLEIGGNRVLRVEAASVPNAIAALLLFVRDATLQVPHVYFGWNERGPVANAARFLISGEGDVAVVTHEILRQAEKDRRRRPVVHLGG